MPAKLQAAAAIRTRSNRPTRYARTGKVSSRNQRFAV
jgi:hypothetical protein